jgi:hypothetical protein
MVMIKHNAFRGTLSQQAVILQQCLALLLSSDTALLTEQTAGEFGLTV